MSSDLLTEKEIELVKSSWATIRKDSKTFGNQLFIDLFAKYPPYQNLFKGFIGIPLSELGSTKKLLAHTTNVMYTLTALIDNLEDTECLVAMLAKIGTNHCRHKVTEEMFDQLGPIYVDLLRSSLGSDVFDEQLLNAWSKTYALVIKVIKTGY